MSFHSNPANRRLFTGIWGGIFVLIAGILSIMAANKPENKNLIGCSMAMQIILCFATVIYQITFGISLR